jgi:hypothetical protein
MGQSAKLLRWLRLVTAAIATGFAILALMILPALVGLLPHAIRDYPLEWSAVALIIAFRGAQAFVAARTVDDPAATRARRFLDRIDAGSNWALDGGLALALALFATALMASWAPHYLTWPWCRDEDTFATLAQSWDAGIRPYRDIRSYNFPGHIYLHWLIGRALGWGRTLPFYALDVAALITLGVALTVWSRRRLGGSLPGLVGYVTFLGFYLSQDFEQVAERDWHATFCAAIALMTLEAWPGRQALWTAAALEAVALTIRPHAVFFLPAIGSAIAERPRTARDAAEWGIAFALFTSLGFAPLVAQGLLDDLLSGLRVVAYGGPYSKASLTGSLTILGGELRSPWTIALTASLIMLWLFDHQANRTLARTWLLALAAALLYRTVHPVQHRYLVHPLALIGSIVVALPIARVVSISWLARPLRVLAVMLILLEAIPQIPIFCAPRDCVRALGALARGVEPDVPPPGARYKWFRPHECHYEWTDYCRTLDYLRHATGTGTEIANVLKQPPFPSFNGPVGRLSPFRAESGICWMWLIDVDLDIPFAEALEKTPDSVVVWSSAEIDMEPRLKLERVTSVIRRYYRPEARFGPIEVWRRSPDDGPK